MKVLLIDDDQTVSAALTNALSHDCEVTLAENRNDAMALISGPAHFDIAVCDLRMPRSADNPDDLSEEYGQEVFAELVVRRSGMPVWVCSGYADDDFTEALIRDPRTGDPFGERKTRPLVEKFRKIHLSRVVDQLRDAAGAVRDLEAIEISTYGKHLDLSPEHIRLIQLAARQYGATLMRVRQLTGGLSGARTLAVEGIDVPGGGNQVVNCVMKIDAMAATKEEAERYLEGVPSILPATAFAPLFSQIRAGAGDASALVYSLAAASPVTLATALVESPSSAIEVIERLQDQLAAWSNGGSVTAMTVDELGAVLGAPRIQEAISRGFLLSFSGEVLAHARVQVRSCIQHGDLHALNVLVDQDNRPVVIDFARTTRRIAAYDAVTLEFSILFHPELFGLLGTWPAEEQMRNWDDLQIYLTDCPFPDFVSRCREWGRAVCLGDREYSAAVLAYALRQFTFDVDHHRAQCVAERSAVLLTSA